MKPFEVLHAVQAVLNGISAPWWFCGGWGIDLFLGKETRAHKDIDIAIFRKDQLLFQRFLMELGWELNIAHSGELSSWKPGQYLELPFHTIWCRNSKSDPDFIELLLNENDRSDFLYRKNTSIRRTASNAFLLTENGLPFLAPEIILLYKSGSYTTLGNRHDFEHTVSLLSHEQRHWLISALLTVESAADTTHPWIAEMQ